MGARTAQGQARQTIRLQNLPDDKESHGNDFANYSLLASEYDNTTEYAKMKQRTRKVPHVQYPGIYNNG